VQQLTTLKNKYKKNKKDKKMKRLDNITVEGNKFKIICSDVKNGIDSFYIDMIIEGKAKDIKKIFKLNSTLDFDDFLITGLNYDYSDLVLDTSIYNIMSVEYIRSSGDWHQIYLDIAITEYD
jgi:hypothetical protein